MDDRRAEAFLRIIETGSFSEAARRMFVTQPTVTHQIKSLEASLGVRLLDRTGGRVRPTRAGEIAAGYLRRIEELDHAMRQELVRFMDESREFVIACGDNMVTYDYPAFERVVRCAAQLTGARVRVVSTPAVEEVPRLLEAREIDAAFTLIEPLAQCETVECVELLTSRNYIVCAASHPLAARGHLGAADLDGLTVLLPRDDAQDIPHFVDDVRSCPGVDVAFEYVPTTSGMVPLVEMGDKVGYSPFRVGDPRAVACVPYRPLVEKHLGIAWLARRGDPVLVRFAEQVVGIYREVHVESEDDDVPGAC